MPQEASTNSATDKEQILDQIGLESVKERVRGLRDEVARFEANIKLVETSIEQGKERYKTAIAIQDMMLANDGFKKVTPEFQYETLPEYWELRRKEISYQVEDNKAKFDNDLKMADQRLKMLRESLDSSKKQLDDDLAVLKAHGVEVEAPQ